MQIRDKLNALPVTPRGAEWDPDCGPFGWFRSFEFDDYLDTTPFAIRNRVNEEIQLIRSQRQESSEGDAGGAQRAVERLAELEKRARALEKEIEFLEGKVGSISRASKEQIDKGGIGEGYSAIKSTGRLLDAYEEYADVTHEINSLEQMKYNGLGTPPDPR